VDGSDQQNASDEDQTLHGRCFQTKIVFDREKSGIGFQPVDPDKTGWKPIPRRKRDSYFSLDTYLTATVNQPFFASTIRVRKTLPRIASNRTVCGTSIGWSSKVSGKTLENFFWMVAFNPAWVTLNRFRPGKLTPTSSTRIKITDPSSSVAGL